MQLRVALHLQPIVGEAGEGRKTLGSAESPMPMASSRMPARSREGVLAPTPGHTQGVEITELTEQQHQSPATPLHSGHASETVQQGLRWGHERVALTAG